MLWDGREKKDRCRGPGAARDVHLQSLVAKEAFAIPGDTGDTGFTASWGVGCEGMGQEGIISESQDGLVLEGP